MSSNWQKLTEEIPGLTGLETLLENGAGDTGWDKIVFQRYEENCVDLKVENIDTTDTLSLNFTDAGIHYKLENDSDVQDTGIFDCESYAFDALQGFKGDNPSDGKLHDRVVRAITQLEEDDVHSWELKLDRKPGGSVGVDLAFEAWYDLTLRHVRFEAVVDEAGGILVRTVGEFLLPDTEWSRSFDTFRTYAVLTAIKQDVDSVGEFKTLVIQGFNILEICPKSDVFKIQLSDVDKTGKVRMEVYMLRPVQQRLECFGIYYENVVDVVQAIDSGALSFGVEQAVDYWRNLDAFRKAGIEPNSFTGDGEPVVAICDKADKKILIGVSPGPAKKAWVRRYRFEKLLWRRVVPLDEWKQLKVVQSVAQLGSETTFDSVIGLCVRLESSILRAALGSVDCSVDPNDVVVSLLSEGYTEANILDAFLELYQDGTLPKLPSHSLPDKPEGYPVGKVPGKDPVKESLQESLDSGTHYDPVTEACEEIKDDNAKYGKDDLLAKPADQLTDDDCKKVLEDAAKDPEEEEEPICPVGFFCGIDESDLNAQNGWAPNTEDEDEDDEDDDENDEDDDEDDEGHDPSDQTDRAFEEFMRIMDENARLFEGQPPSCLVCTQYFERPDEGVYFTAEWKDSPCPLKLTVRMKAEGHPELPDWEAVVVYNNRTFRSEGDSIGTIIDDYNETFNALMN